MMKPYPLLLLLTLANCVQITECRVTDGDTLRCNRERVRLNGIDAPELGTIGGDLAKQRMKRLVERGDITITKRFKKDRYGRTVAQVEADGLDLSCAMLITGHARYVEKWDERRQTARICKGLASF